MVQDFPIKSIIDAVNLDLSFQIIGWTVKAFLDDGITPCFHRPSVAEQLSLLVKNYGVFQGKNGRNCCLGTLYTLEIQRMYLIHTCFPTPGYVKGTGKKENMGYTLPGKLTAGSTKHQPIEIRKVVIWVSKPSFAPVQHVEFLPVPGYNLIILIFAYLILGESFEKNHPKWWWIMVQSNKKISLIKSKTKLLPSNPDWSPKWRSPTTLEKVTYNPTKGVTRKNLD